MVIKRKRNIFLWIFLIVVLCFILAIIVKFSIDKLNLQKQFPSQEVLTKTDWGTFSWRDINYAKHSANLYFTYFDNEGEHTKLLMGHISLENEPLNVMNNGERFIFELSGPGEGIAYFVSNDRPPFNVKQLKLPANWDQQTDSFVIGWIDQKRILFKTIVGFSLENQQVTYWISPVDSVENAEQVFIK